MTNITEKPVYVSREEKNGITKELLNELFDYKDGILYWKIARSNAAKIGNKASKNYKGTDYYKVSISKLSYRNSRLIFFLFNNYFPEQVDHIDRSRLNDRIDNLRAATREENCRNCSPSKNKLSQYLGVFFKEGKYWTAAINVNRKQIHLGHFQTEELAALAYNRAAVKHFGEFANLNIIK